MRYKSIQEDREGNDRAIGPSGIFSRVCVIMITGWLAGCALPFTASSSFQTQTEHLLIETLTHIKRAYIENANLENLTHDAIAALHELDPTLSLEITQKNRWSLIRDQRVISKVTLPTDHTVEAWAETATTLLADLWKADTNFNHHDLTLIHEILFSAMTARLDRYSYYIPARPPHQSSTVNSRIPKDKIIDDTLFTLRIPQTSRTVFLERRETIALIKITEFQRKTATQVAAALNLALIEAAQKKETLDAIILDLRGNTGGLLNEAIATADLFLDKGLVSRTVGRHPQSHQTYNARPGDLSKGRPIVLLIDHNTASAAEVLAAALQDHKRALVIGTTSFGKGRVQTIVKLSNNAILVLSWARLLSPHGTSLHQRGINPDICLQSGIFGNTQNCPSDPTVPANPQQEEEMALKLLKDPRLYITALSRKPVS